MKRGKVKKFQTMISTSNFDIQQHYYENSNWVENKIKHQRTNFERNFKKFHEISDDFIENVIDIFELSNYLITDTKNRNIMKQRKSIFH